METVDKALTIFNENTFHHIPIVDENMSLVGMISRVEINLISDWGTRFNLESSNNRNRKLMSSFTTADIMQKNLVTVEPSAKLEDCVVVFRKNKIHSLPVIDNGVLVGIITTHDLLNIAYQSASRYNQQF